MQEAQAHVGSGHRSSLSSTAMVAATSGRSPAFWSTSTLARSTAAAQRGCGCSLAGAATVGARPC